ncbi:sigma-70 family RNA polymerase sigma factor [Sorangium sp. So ce119]|uniref:RNA polymerase sigma factor n=1 Tax=Sorangium sp. So ce119 TaxID=3133279 RepID=UPI003F5E6283
MSFLWPSRDDQLCELLDASRRGDRRAFRALYLELYDPVARFVARRVGRREDAEDLVARAFHKLLERLGEFDRRKGTPRMFVLSMARNLVIDHLRAARQEAPIDDLAGVLADEAGTPLDALVRGEELRAVRAALLELGAEAREVLVLRYGDELKHQEIADLLGIRADAAKQRASRALRELKARIEARDEEEAAGEARAEGVSDAGL